MLSTRVPFGAPLLGHERLKIRGRYTETCAHFAYDFSAHERIAHTRNGLGQASGQLDLRSKRSEIDIGCLALNPVIEKIASACDAPSKVLFAFAPDERVWIFAHGDFGHTHNQVILEQGIERTFGGLLARCVGVKAKHNFIDEA